MKAYYNEFDKKKCSALQELMNEGHITKGDIDDRSIHDVRGSDLKGYTRAHLFAGIGLWDHSLNLAGWPKDRPVWTGSCPCQPFSSAGRQAGKDDDRHLWPEWERLISECSPPTVFGEQVSSAITKGWLDDVYQGMEAQGYAVGSAVLPASSVGAPHRRERLWFVAQSESVNDRGRPEEIPRQNEQQAQEPQRTTRNTESSSSSTLGNSEHKRLWFVADSQSKQRNERECGNNSIEGRPPESAFRAGRGNNSTLGNACSQGLQGHRGSIQESVAQGWEGTERHPWSSGVWIDCPDGKQRLVEPRIPLLADGYPERVGVIHCAGDAIVPQVAAEFIGALIA